MKAEEKRWCDAVHSLETCSLCGKFGIQWAHSNQDRGMGQKAHPSATAALCPECHFELDNGRDLSQAERRQRMDRAIVRTHIRLAQLGKLKVAA